MLYKELSIGASWKRVCEASDPVRRSTSEERPTQELLTKMATLGITEMRVVRASWRAGDAQGTVLRSPMPPSGARIAPAPLQAPRVDAWTDAPCCVSPNEQSSSQSTEQTAVVELQPQARRTPRLPSDVRRSSVQRIPGQTGIDLQRLHAPRPLPQWGTVIQRDFFNLETVGRIEVERLAPRLEVPPGTFLCCCGLDGVLCDGRGRFASAWNRIAIRLATRLDLMSLRCVAYGSSSAQQFNPQDATGRHRVGLMLVVVCMAILSIFIVSAFASSCGCLIHP